MLLWMFGWSLMFCLVHLWLQHRELAYLAAIQLVEEQAVKSMISSLRRGEIKFEIYKI